MSLDSTVCALFAMALIGVTAACEPEVEAVEAPMRVNGTTCITGTLSADFENLIVGVPADRPARVQDEGGAAVDVDAALSEDSAPAFSLLRAPFVADDATVVPLRVQLTAAGVVTGGLVLTPATGSPCTLELTASDGAIP